MNKKFKLGKISHFIILGGSLNSLNFCKFLKAKKVKFSLFLNKRQANEIFGKKKLKLLLSQFGIKFFLTENLNKNKFFLNLNPINSLIIGFGEPWKIDLKILRLYKNRALDFMGIPMPMYRGGAHYTWMIINQSRIGGAYIQNIDANTIQGKSDTNMFLFGKNYNYPSSLKIPIDFFNYSCKKELEVLKMFYRKVKLNSWFNLKTFKKKNSLFFPRLKSTENSYINWHYNDNDIFNFINAFDDPYKGAQTFIKNKKIFIKKIYKLKKIKVNFGEFSKGLIVNKNGGFVYIALNKCIIITKNIFDEKNNNIVNKIKIGQRLYTPYKYIDSAMKFLRNDI